MTSTTTTTESRVIGRYVTLGGAPIVVIEDAAEARRWNDGMDPYDQVSRWECLGCGESRAPGYGDGRFLTQDKARRRANDHAGECRSMPLVSAPSPGDELAAIRAEVTTLRMDMAGIAAAVRGLTATIATAAAPLTEAARAVPDITAAVSDLPDHREVLGDIATGVESLAAAVDDRPRRSWWGRRRSTQAGEVSA